MAELEPIRATLREKLGVKDRQLQNLIRKKEGETLFPRRLAILSLAAENSVPIHRFATEDELSQLREHRLRAVANRTPEVPDRRPVERRSPRRQEPRAPRPAPTKRGRKVFVVHGRNESVRKALFAFLRAVGLEPIEWGKAIQATGKPTPSISEILDAAFAQAAAVVVLLTPDDQAILSSALQKPSDPSYEKELVGQARPNVLFEAGLAFGSREESTVLVQVGSVKPFSDAAGRHITRLSNTPHSRSEFVTKLRNAGCAVDIEGKTEWYTEGDFDA